MRRFRIRLGLLAAGVVALWFGTRYAAKLQVRGELLRARQEIAAGRFETARSRLAALSSRHPGALGGEVDYWLGVSESSLGHPDAALDAFARVPRVLDVGPRRAQLEAEANLRLGRLRSAEQVLEDLLKQGGHGLNEVRQVLARVYEIQLRVDDAIGVYRDSLPEADDAFPLLQRISTLEGGTLPLESLRATLEEAGGLAPDDDRVWLGQARLAMQMGRWDQARIWLDRCRERHADAPVWRAWLEWARRSDLPAEVLRAVQGLGAEGIPAPRMLEILAWSCRQAGDTAGERQALTSWLAREPRSIPALERLAAIAERPEERAAHRRLKAEIDRALDQYRFRVRLGSAADFQTTEDKMRIVRIADTAGLQRDARDWLEWIRKVDPGNAYGSLKPSDFDFADKIDKAVDDLFHKEAQEKLLATLTKLAARPANESGAGVRHVERRGAGPDSGKRLVSFVDDAESAGLKFVYRNGESKIHQIPETTGGGVGLLDYDGDGWVDVFVVQGGTFPPAPDRPSTGDRLFRNLRDGRFEDVTEKAGLAGLSRSYGHGVAVADHDNDGRPDLFLTRWRGYVLLRNTGDGRFEDVTEKAGLGGDRDWPTSAAFADIDGDGDLDLYVCHYGVWDAENPKLCRNESSGEYISCNPLELPARPDHLFRNDGGRFVDITEAAGIVDRNGRGLGVVAADLDEDGKIDFYVANDLTANYFWRNLGNGRFEEIGHESGVAGSASGGYQASMGVAPGDLDGDGKLDLAVTNFYGECTSFYHNLGSGAFSDSTSAIGLDVATRQLLGFGIVFLDADNDGTLDLASANGHVNDLRPHFPYLMRAQLLLGDARGRLTDASERAGDVWKADRMGRALASGDLDNDGLVDLVLLSHNQPLAYLHNRSRPGHFVSVQLRGKQPGTTLDAVGARVSVSAGGTTRTGWRCGGGSYQSASDRQLHFGLGRVERIDEIAVTWPSGRVDRHRGLPADRGYLIVEGAGRPEPLPGYGAGPKRGAQPL